MQETLALLPVVAVLMLEDNQLELWFRRSRLPQQRRCSLLGAWLRRSSLTALRWQEHKMVEQRTNLHEWDQCSDQKVAWTTCALACANYCSPSMGPRLNCGLG